MIALSKQEARRYLLARQGLWPARKWSGKEGAAEAIHALESVQVDPVTVVARSHDLVLWSRVEGYEPRHLDELLYTDRRFFDYGGHLDIYPMQELPFWAAHMRRHATAGRWATWAAKNTEVVERVRALVRERGPTGNRDLEGPRTVSGNYRSGKETGLALYYLWITGELMTSGRRGFDRLYDLKERVAPAEHRWEATQEQAFEHFAAKALRYHGLTTAGGWAGSVAYWALGSTRQIDRRLIEKTGAVPVTVEGVREPYYAPPGASFDVPDASPPDEVNLLSPLDNLLARRRTQALFGFDYVWEVYKKPELRRYGRYTLPVLYGDRLVARLEPRLDRKVGVMAVDGFWPEEGAPTDGAYAEALLKGLTRFAAFHGARLDPSGLPGA